MRKVIARSVFFFCLLNVSVFKPMFWTMYIAQLTHVLVQCTLYSRLKTVFGLKRFDLSSILRLHDIFCFQEIYKKLVSA